MICPALGVLGEALIPDKRRNTDFSALTVVDAEHLVGQIIRIRSRGEPEHETGGEN